jgi:hypothetical protein
MLFSIDEFADRFGFITDMTCTSFTEQMRTSQGRQREKERAREIMHSHGVYVPTTRCVTEHIREKFT